MQRINWASILLIFLSIFMLTTHGFCETGGGEEFRVRLPLQVSKSLAIERDYTFQKGDKLQLLYSTQLQDGAYGRTIGVLRGGEIVTAEKGRRPYRAHGKALYQYHTCYRSVIVSLTRDGKIIRGNVRSSFLAPPELAAEYFRIAAARNKEKRARKNDELKRIVPIVLVAVVGSFGLILLFLIVMGQWTERETAPLREWLDSLDPSERWERMQELAKRNYERFLLWWEQGKFW